ncbi:MBL fold metallo-hydrolase [Diaphorobacter caeni]|uniref:MBL fold metallo-hydrolase n=1 Tax=Diaphorobacter caeni TaxID=2784387 RepID=UPI00188DE68D|nr:MBL fold metallo-hydrolase [Diaphorobacter caeni]MBF5003466.1 MBL fold metallo-hydrolase [Diaphorobacter caeni]
MLRFKSLGSGSSGNSTLIEGRSGTTTRRLLVDCGLGIRTIAERLGEAGNAIAQIDAIFITHEHSDHIGCMEKLALRHGIPVWMSHGTYTAIGEPELHGLLRIAHHGDAIDMGGAFEALPFAVPHDAREPLHLRCSDGSHHIAVLTDLGHASPCVVPYIADCQALLIEANHDVEMLQSGRYPAFLKRRIAGANGHLANEQAGELLHTINHPQLQRVVAAHLSAENNRPELARAALAHALGWSPDDIDIAYQRGGSPWIQVG